MIVPGKYEDVSRSPVLIGAWILERLRINNSLPELYLAARAGHTSLSYSAEDVTAGLCFLYACGLISLRGKRLVVNEVS